jgi:hypothetical protein
MNPTEHTSPWILFSDDSLSSETVSTSELLTLERLWRKALGELGFDTGNESPFFRLSSNGAEINRELLEQTLGRGLIGQIKTQWRIEKTLTELLI